MAQTSKILAEHLLTFRIDEFKRSHKLLLKFSGLNREKQIEITIDQCFFRPRSIRGRYDCIAEGD